MAKIREVVEQDIDDVLEISKNVWGGHDYLPRRIHEWLANPNCHTYGVEVEGTLVGIANLRIIEEGKIGWFEGLRVHEGHRGKGYANELTDHLVTISQELDVDRIRYTTAEDNVESLALAKRIDMQKILEMFVFWRGDLDQVTWKCEANEVKALSGTDIQMLKDNQVKSVLPSILIHDWKAWDFTLDSLRKRDEKCSYWITHRANEDIGFSIGGIRKEAGSDQWSCTIYASSKEVMFSHLCYHIKFAKRKDFDAVMAIIEPKFVDEVQSLDFYTDDVHSTNILLLDRKLA